MQFSVLETKITGILFLYISVIVCVNLSSNAAILIFKRIADRSVLIEFSNYYRTYLMLTSIKDQALLHNSSFEVNLFKSHF